MEAILQALTYPEIGKMIVSAAAHFNPDPAVARQRHQVPDPERRRLHRRLSRPGCGLADAILEAKAAGIPYMSFSAGWVGLPDQEGALVPGEDYLTVVGEDLCALGESFAEVINDGVGTGKVGMLGGTPGNALTLGWQQCFDPGARRRIELVNPPPTRTPPPGHLLGERHRPRDGHGWLSTTNPDIKGWAYEYSDGLYTGLQAYDELGIPVHEPHGRAAHRRADPVLRLGESDEPELTTSGTRPAATSSHGSASPRRCCRIQGAEIPAEIVVPHVMRQVTAADCNPDRVNAVGVGDLAGAGRGARRHVSERMSDDDPGGESTTGDLVLELRACPGSSVRFGR